jgi:hypothetical protein
MAHRARAKSRLEHKVPGESVRYLSALHDAIVYRARPIESFELRESYGQPLLNRREPKEIPAKTIEAEPNAPLLIRLVRDPYSLELGSMQKSRIRESTASESRQADPFPSAMKEWRKVRFTGFTGNPVKGLAIGPQPRKSPTAHKVDPIGRGLCR